MSSRALADLFFRIAACYDRSGLSNPRSTTGAIPSFQFDLTTGEPRLDEPAFIAAAELLGRLAAAKCFAPDGDTVAALGHKDSPASLAVVSLAELAKLPRRTAPCRPGSASRPCPVRGGSTIPAKDSSTRPFPTTSPIIPAAASASSARDARIPKRRSNCSPRLGGPTRSLEVISSHSLGAGPFRASQLERDRLPIWYGYGLDAERTRQLQEAMQQYVRSEVRTRALGLRGPDQEALSAAASAALGKLATGTPPRDAAQATHRGLEGDRREDTARHATALAKDGRRGELTRWLWCRPLSAPRRWHREGRGVNLVLKWSSWREPDKWYRQYHTCTR